MRQRPYKIAGGALGTKAVTIGDLDEFMEWKASTDNGKKMPQELFTSVAWTFWCVKFRANNIGAMPHGIFTADSTEDKDEFAVDFQIDLAPFLENASTWLDLLGGAYWLKLVNSTGIVGLQALNANTMEIETPDDRNAITLGTPFRFVQTVGGNKKFYDPEEIVYFRTFDPFGDIGKGVSSGQVAALSGSLVLHLNQWASAFFRNNAMPLIVLEAEGQIPDSEIKRLKSAWNRSLQRALNWSVKILRKGMKVNVIGQPIKDLAMPELSKDQKDQIIAAHDLPIGIANDELNRADRQQVEYQLWAEHLIPFTRTTLMPVLNEQLFNPLGLRISFFFKEIEAIQREQTSQAEASAFIFSDVLLPALAINAISVKEYRRELDVILKWMNLPGLDEHPPPILLPSQGDIIEGNAEAVPQIPATTETTPPGGLEKKAPGAMPQTVRSEIRKWAEKCRKRGKAANFNSDIIPDWFHAQIEAAIKSVGHINAFSFLKATDSQVRKLEKEMEAATQAVFDEFRDDVAEDVMEGREPDYVALFAALSAAILPIITGAATDEALRVSASIGIEFDPAFINADAIEWARRYTFELVTGLTNTTRRLVRDSITAFLEVPGMTQGDVEKLLEKAFGEQRAETIATTEITRANAQATNVIQERLNETGLQTIRVWNTKNDELVCPICGPLNGTPEIVWAGKYPSGPPDPHPR